MACSDSGICSGAALISCRQMTSGRSLLIHSSSCTCRARMPLTFQVAIFTTPIYHAGMSGDGDGDGGRDDARSGFPRGAAAVISAGLLVASLGWPALLGRLPLGLFLKNQLGLGPAHIARLWAVGTVAWYAKPLAGPLCDRLPLFG